MKHQAACYMIISGFCVTIICGLGKTMGDNFSLPLLVFVRFFFPWIMLSWINLTHPKPAAQWGSWPTLKPFVKRACFAFASQYTIFYYLTTHSALEGTALLATTPLFIPLLNHWLDKKPLSYTQYLPIAMGFIGVLLMIKPPPHAFIEWSLFVGLSAGLFSAFSQRTLHQNAQKHSAIQNSLYLYTFTSLLALIPLLATWPSIHHSHQLHYLWDSDLLIIFLLFSMASISNQMFRSRAYQLSESIQLLTPLGYSSLIFSSLFDFSQTHTMPDLWACLGALLIAAGGILSVYCKSSLLPQTEFRKDMT